MLLYIACFSNADDDGRLVGDAAHLKALAFRYRRVSEGKTRELRDLIAAKCRSFRVYSVDNTEYIAFLNWSEFQKPKYPKPSALPSPNSSKASEVLGEASAIGLGRDGLGGVEISKSSTSTNGHYAIPEIELAKLLASLKDRDKDTEKVIRSIARERKLPPAAFMFARDCATGPGVDSPVKVAVRMLQRWSL